MIKKQDSQKLWKIIYKIFFALLGFSSLITEIAVLAERGTFNAVNFFSYFTVLSNVIISVSFLVSALATARGSTKKIDAFRIAATIYILVVGLGFAALLSGLEGVQFTVVPWNNIVLHYIVPIAAALDLVIDKPMKKRFVSLLPWLAFPVLYAVYTMIRGAITGWYPYPFLNPAPNGYGSVALGIGGIVAIALIVTFVVSFIGKKQTKA